jgi:hypothetical protein
LNADAAVKPTRSEPVSPRDARGAAFVARSARLGISFTPSRKAKPAAVSSAPCARRRNSDPPISASRSQARVKEPADPRDRHRLYSRHQPGRSRGDEPSRIST